MASSKTRAATDHAEPWAEARKEILAAYEAFAPGIIGNPFVPQWPHPKQWLFLGAHNLAESQRDDHVFQCLFGGAAGPGKSSALLMAAAQHVAYGHFSAVCFRRTYQDLINPGALLDRAMEWWQPAGAHWNGTNGLFTFPSGAKIKMGYMAGPNDHLNHQGAEYHLTCWDELTQHPQDRQYRYVGLSRVRRNAGDTIPLRTLSASNPGGPGHAWVEQMFLGGTDPATGQHRDPEHLFIPATLDDNPSLDREAYVRGLMHLHPTTRAQLLRGDWTARDMGDYFRPEWFGPLLDPEVDTLPKADCRRVRWWDLAASTDENAARTAGVLMARHVRGVRVVEHAIAFRKTPGARDDAIVRQAKMDGHHVTVGIEIEGGSGGIAQFLALEKRLTAAGFQVVGARPRSDQTHAEADRVIKASVSDRAKAARADPVASCLERGHQRRGECPDTGGEWWGADAEQPLHAQRDGIRLMAGPWTRDYLSELQGFPEAALKDFVDATSGAWAWLESHPVGFARPPQFSAPQPFSASHDVHPDDRPEPKRERFLRP